MPSASMLVKCIAENVDEYWRASAEKVDEYIYTDAENVDH